MRHTIMLACSLLLLFAVQGTALADDMKIPSPPPSASDDSCALLTECQTSLGSCQQDVETLLPALAKCEGTDVETVKKKYDIVGADTTVKVVKRTPKKPRKPRKPKTPTKAPEVKQGPIGPQGPAGPKGDDGERGANGVSSRIKVLTEAPGKNCPTGGQHMMIGLDVDGNGLDDGEVETDVYVCNGVAGKSGSAGRPGRDGNTFIQVGVGARAASIVSAGRPTGRSIAPELQLELWLSPIVEFTLGTAWAAGGDRNTVLTGQLCRRALNKRLGFCAGGQYHGWKLEGNLAQWHSGLGIVSLKVVPIETKYVDVSFEAGGGVGFDGYDEDMQFAWGLTGQWTVTIKL